VPTLVLAGACAGGGGTMVVAPMLMVMSHRSTDRDRGSGFAFFYVAMALGFAIGSFGGAPLVEAGGFSLAMGVLGISGLAVSAGLTVLDPGLGRRGGVAIVGPTDQPGEGTAMAAVD
jgi:predicted MFS family arabinose efflux permease